MDIMPLTHYPLVNGVGSGNGLYWPGHYLNQYWHQPYHYKQTSVKMESKYGKFHWHLKISSAKYPPFCLRDNRVNCYRVGGLVQDCSNSSALAMELLQSWTEPSICDGRLWLGCVISSLAAILFSTRINLTRWGDAVAISKALSLNTCYGLSSWAFLGKLLSGECHRTHSMIR